MIGTMADITRADVEQVYERIEDAVDRELSDLGYLDQEIDNKIMTAVSAAFSALYETLPEEDE